MKNRLNELNEKALKLMQEQRDFAKEAIKSGKTALPWEVWVNVMSEETGYEPKRVGVVSVEKVMGMNTSRKTCLRLHNGKW